MIEGHEFELLTEACRAVQLEEPPSGYDGLALCVIDAIWSMGVRYQAVERVVTRYREWLLVEGAADPEVRNARDLAEDSERVGGPSCFADEVARNRQRTSSRNGVLKAQAVADAAGVLAQLNVLTVEDLVSRAAEPIVEDAWCSVRGQRSGISWHYVRMLAGIDEIKADRMVCRFVNTAVGRKVSSPDARDALLQVVSVLRADLPDITARGLDYAIWTVERRRRS